MFKLKSKVFLLSSSIFILASCSTCQKEICKNPKQQAHTSTTTVVVQEDMINSKCDDNLSVDRAYFALNSSTLSNSAQQDLREGSEYIKNHPDETFIIEGHCDERGTREYNLALGERRAESAKKYLISIGVNSHQLETVSYGKEMPAVLGHDEEAWSLNRRVVIVPKSEKF